MSAAVDHLWSVVRLTPSVDATALARAVEEALGTSPLDYRTQLLVRDAVTALEAYWGAERFRAWLRGVPNRERIEEARRTGDDLNEVGFPSLERRLMDAVTPETVEAFLRELSLHVNRPTRLVVGGSIALILAGHVSRHTDDVDIVDEVPAEIREQHDLLGQLADRYGLQITHFQSHYLNAGWEQRIRSAGAFGNLHVYAVDPYDVFVGKLFSVRPKDRDDLRVLSRRLDRETIVRRLQETARALRADARLAQAAADNWFVVFGETLPD